RAVQPGDQRQGLIQELTRACPEARRGVPAGTLVEPFRPGCCTVKPLCPSRALHTLEGSSAKPHHAATLLSTAKTTLLPAMGRRAGDRMDQSPYCLVTPLQCTITH